MEPEWTVRTRGGSLQFDYEIAVLKRSNKFGYTTWGAGSLEKIVLFSSRLGGNEILPWTRDKFREAMAIAQLICDALNAAAAAEDDSDTPHTLRNYPTTRGA